MSRPLRGRVLGRLALVVGVGLAGLLPCAAASAGTDYEYWSYWHKPPGATTWQYSSVGASGYYLRPGTQVEGWRFAVGTAGPSDPQPRPADVSYDSYCAGHDTSRTYRVLLIVDYGTMSGAPAGPVYSCFGFDQQQNGWEVLNLVHHVRDNGGMVCGIDGYPKSGCGEVVAAPSSSAPPRATSGSGSGPATTASRHSQTRASAVTRPAGAAATTGPTGRTSPTGPTGTTGTVRRGSTSAGTAPGSDMTAAQTATDPAATASAAAAQPRAFDGRVASTRSTFPLGLTVGLVAIVLLGGGALWLRR